MVFCNIEKRLQCRLNSGHNPYFNRWFSAITSLVVEFAESIVTILILIDGFLQYGKSELYKEDILVTILILIDGFLQYKKIERSHFGL